MSDYLFQYRGIDPTTWVYLSSLLLVGLFFKFGRLWSVRNLDLILLILLGPGLLMVHHGQSEQGRLLQTAQAQQQIEAAASDPSTDEDANTEAVDAEAVDETASRDEAANNAAVATPALAPNLDSKPDAKAGESTSPNTTEDTGEGVAAEWIKLEVWGFIYLLGVGGLVLTRLLLDPMMVRRPLLEPNLSRGGLMFIGISLYIFLMANVISEPELAVSDDAADYRIARVAAASKQGPGYELLNVLPTGLSKAFCIGGQLLIVVGIVLISFWHFRNTFMGIGAATLYLMLPYTSMLTGRIEHILPAATLVWAVLMYRRPLVAGSLIGLASGLVYYPFFLLPLWISFYWHRGFRRFLTAYVVTLSSLIVVLSIFSPNGLVEDLSRMTGFRTPAMEGLGGIWNVDAGGLHPSYRLPVLVAFIAMSISMALWPAQKNLGTLLSCTAAIMMASQFWHGYGGGTYMAWYLPLMLLMIFRPNLEDRVAVSVLGEGWFPKRRLAKAA